jgi:multiple sugar transport system permease protein
VGFLFILPGLLGFGLFFIAPFGIALGYGFMDKPVNGSFVGLQNFIRLFQNSAYLTGLKNTLVFIAYSVPLTMALALAAALLINGLPRHRPLFTLLLLIPLVIPSGSMVYFWRLLFGASGVLNGWLRGVGLGKISWLETAFSQGVILLIFIWKNIGYNMVLFLSGLNNIPVEYYEAARVDGAGRRQMFRHVTAVCLAPTFVLVLMMSLINSFKVFKEVYLLMGAYPHESVYTLQHFMNNLFYALDYQKLAAATTVFVLLMTGLTQFLFKLERKVAA